VAILDNPTSKVLPASIILSVVPNKLADDIVSLSLSASASLILIVPPAPESVT